MQVNPHGIIADLQRYFEEIEHDAMVSPNAVCHKGYCDCCANDFEISIIEYFMILRFLNVRYGEAYVQMVRVVFMRFAH